MKRQIINIDEEKCNGCGLCVPECKEGAIRIIEGKARLISDLFCDGLGACLGHCPEDAITVEEREAEPYDEILVMEKLIAGPMDVIKEHLRHLKDHRQIEYFSQAVNFLEKRGIENPLKKELHKTNGHAHEGGRCPGSRIMEIKPRRSVTETEDSTARESRLAQWPVQMHLVSPYAPYFRDAELVIMSTCGPLANANIHDDYLRDRAVVVGCPKLDNTTPYADKLSEIFSQANTPKAIVVIMEVPCCGGLSMIAVEAAEMSGRDDLVIEQHVLGVNGDLLHKSVIFSKEIITQSR